MASYPTSVKSYTTKSDGAGNKIFASHINDLQDEVTAIEDGLLNGTAPVSCSNATVNRLNVGGASTFAGGLVVSSGGGFTAKGALVLSGFQAVTLSTGDSTGVVVNAQTTYLQLTGNSSGSSVHGLAVAGNTAGRLLLIQNAGAADIVFPHNAASVTSTNRFGINNSSAVTLKSADGVVCLYDGLLFRFLTTKTL